MKLQKEAIKEKPQKKFIIQHEPQPIGNTLQVGEIVVSSAGLSMKELLQVTRELLQDKEIQSYLRLSRLKSIGSVDYAG